MLRSNWSFHLTVLLIVSSFCCLGAANAAEPGLVAYWSMDAGDGNVVIDDTGNGNEGTGPFQWVDGVEGKAIQLDGTTVSCGAGAGLTVSPMTCMFWMRPSEDFGPGDARRNIVYYACGPMFALNPPHWDPDVKVPDGSVMAWICGPEPDVGTATFTKNRLKWPKDEWHHLAMTFDEKVLICYVDGEEQDRMIALGPIKPRKNNFMIGSAAFKGAIDELKLYDRALSKAQIAASAGLAVEPADKLAATWGEVKYAD